VRSETIAILGVYASFAVLELLRSNLLHKKGQTRDDSIIELVSTFGLLLFTQPLVLFLAAAVARMIVPQYEGALADINVFAAIFLFLVLDDMMQYWWHRLSHATPYLYNLHRAHHNASYMSVRLVFRNNLFYYLGMPAIWFSGVLIYLGLGWVYAFYVAVKLIVIIAAHSDLCWDKPLYSIKFLSPIMWIVERTISTPATHHAHHGMHREDGVTHYKGNYGNLLFFWDVLFGTAKITRRYPETYGVENLPATRLGEQLAWPIFRMKD
jgi:sterol desaturase/sphingolipid hydroxylase (fatty acid hydroxylase superfamily)